MSSTRIYQDISIPIKNLDSTCHDLWCYICLLLGDCKHPSMCLRSSHLSSGWLTSTCWSSRSSKCSGASAWSLSLTVTLTSTSTELPLSCLSHSRSTAKNYPWALYGEVSQLSTLKTTVCAQSALTIMVLPTLSTLWLWTLGATCLWPH